MKTFRFAASAALVLATACSSPAPSSGAPAAPAAPLNVQVLAGGLENPWDIGFLPDGSGLVTQRSGELALVGPEPGDPRPVRADLGDVHAQGEGGLMGLLVHPDFANNRQFLTCQAHQENGTAADIRLVKWRLAEDGSSAERVGDLLTGLPLNPSGRHSGCRPELAADGALLVSTGDTARAPIAQDRTSLGGKILRLDLDTGAPLPDNPFINAPDPAQRLVHSYGHRNPQGLAAHPDGRVFIAEHGPDVDDEVNVLEAGGNYGWDPSRGGSEDSYDESVPMTDLQRFPNAVAAVWSSGSSTEAISGAEVLTGAQWGELDGALAVPALKGSKLLLFRTTPEGVEAPAVPAELDGTSGRLRTAQQGPDGALYITTANGSDDEILRVTR